MFKNRSIADFEINGHKASFSIDSDMPVYEVQTVLNRLMHYCVERITEVENEMKQQAQDEEAVKAAELEQVEKQEEVATEEAVVEEEVVAKELTPVS